MSKTVDLITPLVVCTDGPMVNQWFTADDWASRIEAAQHMRERHPGRPAGHPAVVCLAYRDSGRTVAHPSKDGRTGRELVVR